MKFLPATAMLLVCMLAGCILTKRPCADAPPCCTTNRTAQRQGLTRLPTVAPAESNDGVIQLASHQAEPLPAADDGEEIPPEVSELPVPVVGDGLTLPDLEQLALRNNPTLAEAQARVAAAQGNWVQVGLWPNTVLGYTAQHLGSGGKAEQQGLYVQQQFIRGGKLRLNREVAAREVQIAESELAAQQQRVMTDVRLGYYDVLVAQRRIETTKQLIDIAERAVKTTEALFNAKEAAKVDVTRARIELQTTRILDRNAKNAYDGAWGRLSAVLGLPCYGSQPLVDTLSADMQQLDPCESINRILSQSPELAAAFAEVERARWAVERANAQPVPNLNVAAVAQSDNGTNSANANLQVTMPIPWLNRNQGGIAQAFAELAAAEQAVGQVQLNLYRRLALVYQRYADARNQVREYAQPDGILDNAAATLESIRIGYEAGEFAYLDLITAQKTYSQVNLAYIESLGEFWAAVAEIEGLLLKGSLEVEPASRR